MITKPRVRAGRVSTLQKSNLIPSYPTLQNLVTCKEEATTLLATREKSK